VDAFASFEIVAGGVTRRFSTPSPCMSTDSSDLQHSLYCAANPIGNGCTEIH
jgi:hypothetical protein